MPSCSNLARSPLCHMRSVERPSDVEGDDKGRAASIEALRSDQSFQHCPVGSTARSLLGGQSGQDPKRHRTRT
ncbi:hypothetical protein E2C01_043043 [Portunus trituberculatus]|uniref:Uncharacterized protein n=1 Tax=Portunus trituberculatus TaxID=210409 RepID=A0A5B7FUL5_PORTR|nr:hypothetical protein [Portunus trituberculatus]